MRASGHRQAKPGASAFEGQVASHGEGVRRWTCATAAAHAQRTGKRSNENPAPLVRAAAGWREARGRTRTPSDLQAQSKPSAKIVSFGSSTKVASTVQSACTASVVKTPPNRLPPQLPPTLSSA